MKRYTFVLLLAVVMPFVAAAQGNKAGQRTVSPFIEGKQKVRVFDYDSIWKFTVFDTKKKYFCPFDYTQLPTILDARHPQWGNFAPVMNYLVRMPRSPLRICALFAINPAIQDDAEKASLTEAAKSQALENLQLLQSWMQEEKMRNKLQLQVAQVDYRYWQGMDFFATEQPSDPIIYMGYILYFGTKKVDLFPSAASGAKEFRAVKFFPNDATVVESYEPLMDELAQYLSENERLEVLLRGYTDNSGTDAYCTGLARQRATEIKKKLVARGISEFRVEIEAKGSSDPIGDNDTYEGRIANNRVTITIQ